MPFRDPFWGSWSLWWTVVQILRACWIVSQELRLRLPRNDYFYVHLIFSVFQSIFLNFQYISFLLVHFFHLFALNLNLFPLFYCCELEANYTSLLWALTAASISWFLNFSGAIHVFLLNLVFSQEQRAIIFEISLAILLLIDIFSDLTTSCSICSFQGILLLTLF